MANRGNRSNPSDVAGPNEYSGLLVAPKRADKSTINYYGDDPSGSTVNRGTINRTKDAVSSKGSQAMPGGTSSGSGF
jgi:hypothetical protein